MAWFNEAVDESSVENTANWRVVEGGSVDMPVLSAVWDDIDGDRVTITTTMQAGGNYELIPDGPIMDLAGMASNNTANAMDLGDAANTHAFSIGSSLTITMGASGHEHIRIPVHDSAMIGPGLQTWSHDRVMTFEVNPNPGVTTGFVGHNPLVVQLQPLWKYIRGEWRRERQIIAERDEAPRAAT